MTEIEEAVGKIIDAKVAEALGGIEVLDDGEQNNKDAANIEDYLIPS